MSHLVLDETNTSSSGTELVGESQDWGGNDYVLQAKTRPNGVTEIRGIGGIDAVRVEGRGVEADDEVAADADDAVAVQAVSDRSAWALLIDRFFARSGLPRSPQVSAPVCTKLELHGS